MDIQRAVSVRRSRIDGNPEFAALATRWPDRYPFLLQSTDRANGLGQYEILFAFPSRPIVADAESAGSTAAGGFLDRLDTAFRLDALPPDVGQDDDIPFKGGWFLFLGYELAGDIEPGLPVAEDKVLPRAFAVRCHGALVRHLDTGVVEAVIEAGAPVDEQQLYEDIRSLGTAGSAGRAATGIRVASIAEEDPVNFLDAVRRAKRYVAAGDIYQANLSREWNIETAEDIDTLELFRSLSRSNPAPFAGLVHWNDACVVSSSPERLVNVRNGCISTRPIAGTRPRSIEDGHDQALLDDLITDPKERAEHVMLIDLERNDLGRVCQPGTVEVDEMMVVESYAHVHHIVSNVRGVLRDETTPGDIIAAVFPGGTITGCPKVRCMEIINELEGAPRGAYTGSIGYLARDGSMDLNILIRTIVTRGSTAAFRAGAGIVADSDPETELEETRAKAEGLLRAFRT